MSKMLKSCPFCGGEATEMDDLLVVGVTTEPYVRCKDCRMGGKKSTWQKRVKGKIPLKIILTAEDLDEV